MKTQINLKTQNKRGNEPNYKEDLGYITTFIEGKHNASISIDMFDGQGETYKRRETPIISIFYGGLKAFEGNTAELIEKLK